MSSLEVSLVAADRTVWTGQAKEIIARTTEGELGVMPGHTPLLALLAEGEVKILDVDGGTFTAEVNGGFLSITPGHVRVVAESATVGTAPAN